MSGTSKTILLTNNDIASSDIAFSSFSGYIGFIGEVSAQYGGTPGKIISVVLGVSSGIITGAFDHKLNPNKEMDNITGAVVAGIGAGWIGGKAGFFLGGPIER